MYRNLFKFTRWRLMIKLKGNRQLMNLIYTDNRKLYVCVLLVIVLLWGREVLLSLMECLLIISIAQEKAQWETKGIVNKLEYKDSQNPATPCSLPRALNEVPNSKLKPCYYNFVSVFIFLCNKLCGCSVHFSFLEGVLINCYSFISYNIIINVGGFLRNQAFDTKDMIYYCT